MIEFNKQSRKQKLEEYEKDYLERLKIVDTSTSSSKIYPYEKSWAVVIGINKYQNVTNLENAVNDAMELADLLRNIGFDKIIQIYDEDANKNSILSQFLDDDQLPSQIGEKDRIIIFFSGHGTTNVNLGDNSSSGYLIPSDGTIGKWSSCIEFNDFIAKTVQKLQANHILFLLDCCFGGIAAVRLTSEYVKNKLPMQEFVKSCTRNKAVQIIVAGQKDELVLDQSIFSGHSPFTGAIIEGIESNNADLSNDGILTATELGTYLDRRVSDVANVYGHKQKPMTNRLAGDKGGDFIINISTEPKIDEDGVTPVPNKLEPVFDEILNQRRKDFNIFGINYSPSEVMKKVDKTKYDMMLKDWLEKGELDEEYLGEKNEDDEN